MERIGLIAGNGRLPFLFAEEARRRGISVVAVAHRGETDPALEAQVDALAWVRVGQLNGIVRALRSRDIRRAVMAGGIGRIRSLHEARPDLGAVKVALRLRNFRDDALLRAMAGYFGEGGVEVVSLTPYLGQLLAPAGRLGGPELSAEQRRDVELGVEVARALGRADVGQTVVLKGGVVLALEAVEGTDHAIRRGAQYGGAGAVVVKMCKPGQDERFDLPAVGSGTLKVMAEVGARVLAVEAGRSLLLDPAELAADADRLKITVWGVS